MNLRVPTNTTTAAAAAANTATLATRKWKQILSSHGIGDHRNIKIDNSHSFGNENHSARSFFVGTAILSASNWNRKSNSSNSFLVNSKTHSLEFLKSDHNPQFHHRYCLAARMSSAVDTTDTKIPRGSDDTKKQSGPDPSNNNNNNKNTSGGAVAGEDKTEPPKGQNERQGDRGGNANSNSGNKRKSNQSKHRTGWSDKRSKKNKKDNKKNHTWRQDGKGGDKDGDGEDAAAIDWKSKDPSTGSFAHPSLREEFNVTLWKDEDEKKAVLDSLSTEATSKRKVAMLIGFLGTKYGGFQSNPKQRTLQAEIELAMFRTGLINETNFGFPHKYSWSNAARTDKGVHACAQVCSAKVMLTEQVCEDPSGEKLDRIRERMNELLPDDIQIVDIVRTTRSFCAKTARDRVRYQYMVPSFLLHPDWKPLFDQNGITGNRQQKREQEREHERDNTAGESGGQEFVGGKREPYLSKDEIKKIQDTVKGYRSTEESRKRLQQALDKYEGTKQYQSFTRGLKPGQAQAARYVENFVAQDPIIVDDVEWIPTQVLGQSFLLHQIRKMISVAVDVARGAAPLDFLDGALTKHNLYKINTAPAEGLFLEMSLYGGYNRHKDKQNAGRLPDLDWTKAGAANDRWSAMRDVIRKHIIQEEAQLGSFVHYMYVQDFVYGVRENYKLDGDTGTGVGVTGEVDAGNPPALAPPPAAAAAPPPHEPIKEDGSAV
mmetsp:Transcript_22849/g.54131  ORF Transcript_22849/g.54131 Transcript_22849/m.54131 type:complete len:714 (-) Transcript_22849:57-2198(-)